MSRQTTCGGVMSWKRNQLELTVLDCNETQFPWDYEPEKPLPVDKQERDAFLVNKETCAYIVSVNAGQCAQQRVGEDNQLRCLQWIVCDYDHYVGDNVNLDAVRALKAPFRPQWIERTGSGNHRLWWRIEGRPLFIPGNKAFKAWAKYLLDHQKLIPFGSLLPRLDIPAFVDASKGYACNGAKAFAKNSDDTIPADIVMGWFFGASKYIDWVELSPLLIPMDVVEAECKRKWPGFSWPGPFELQAQGPTFWVPESTSLKSAVIHESGIYTFSANALKPWWSWEDLLGREFCERYQTQKWGAACEGIYKIEKCEYMIRRLNDAGSETWWAEKQDAVRLVLRKRGLSNTGRKGEMSEVEQALAFMHGFQSVSGASPSVYNPNLICEMEGRVYLNTSTIRLMEAATEATKWGSDGKFPHTSRWLDELFVDEAWTLELDGQPSVSVSQKDWFLAWLQRFYDASCKGSTALGQAVYISGNIQSGKTFLIEVFMNLIFGGMRDASAYLRGDNFGGEVFEAGFIYVDDTVGSQDLKIQNAMADRIKALVSHTHHSCRYKFMTPSRVIASPHLINCLNGDENSLDTLPPIDRSNGDKVAFLRTRGRAEALFVFSSNEERQAMAARELPYFLAWLLRVSFNQLPRDPRYGILAVHDKVLFKASIRGTSNTQFKLLLQDWARASMIHTPDPWRGSFMRLTKDLAAYCQSFGLAATSLGGVLRGVKGLCRIHPHLLQVDQEEDLITIHNLYYNPEESAKAKMAVIPPDNKGYYEKLS